MQEYEQDAERTHILHKEQVEMEQCHVAQRTPVSELIAHNLMRHEPADEDTGQEAHYRQEQLTSHKVEHVEDGHAEDLQSAPST